MLDTARVNKDGFIFIEYDGWHFEGYNLKKVLKELLNYIEEQRGEH